eukprot:TRINITY_DN33907_c0_g1_i1.p1 TRINITY_DN33907_c0_g1~~TRINITY_DN33907_c0_g1_i1.p1  ORF type:complete len:987 (+),score=37.50 TRINITY_DN33907_c0_g1_i1:58-3018(+)
MWVLVFLAPCLLGLVLAREDWATEYCFREPHYTKMASGRGCLLFETTPSHGSLLSASPVIDITFSTALPVSLLPPCPAASPPVPLQMTNFSWLSEDQTSRLCVPMDDCELFNATSWPWNNFIRSNVARDNCSAPSHYPNAVWLHAVSSNTTFLASSASAPDLHTLQLSFAGLPDDECFVLFAIPAFAIPRPSGVDRFYMNDFNGRTMFVRGTGSCPPITPLPSQVPQCFDDNAAADPLEDISPSTPPLPVVATSVVLIGSDAYMKVVVDMPSNITSFTLSTAETVTYGGEVYSVASVNVTITQPSEPVRLIPVHLRQTKHPQWESYYTDERLTMYSDAEVRLFHDQAWDMWTSVGPAVGFVHVGRFENSMESFNPDIWPLHVDSFDYLVAQGWTTASPLFKDRILLCVDRLDTACLPSYRSEFLLNFRSPATERMYCDENGDHIERLTPCAPGMYYNGGVSHGIELYQKGCRRVSPDAALKCQGGSARFPNVPHWPYGQLHSRLTADEEDELRFYESVGKQSTAETIVSAAGQSVTVNGEGETSANGLSASLETLFDASFWSDYLWVEKHSDHAQLRNWRSRPRNLNNVRQCGTGPEMTAWYFNKNRTVDADCDIPPHTCLMDNLTYYAMWRNESYHLTSLPNLDRLSGASSPTTRSKFGFSSSSRLFYSPSPVRDWPPLLDPLAPVKIASYYFDHLFFPCTSAGCGFDPIGADGSRSDGTGAFVMIADWNTYTIRNPLVVEQPDVALSVTYAMDDTRVSGELIIHNNGSFALHADILVEFVGPVVGGLNITEDVSLLAGSFMTKPFVMELRSDWQPGDVVSMNIVANNTVRKGLWQLTERVLNTPFALQNRGFRACDPVVHCSGSGACNSSTGNCICPENSDPSNCEVPLRCDAARDCNGHGSCTPLTGRCACDLPWTGPNCTGSICDHRPPDLSITPYNFYNTSRTCPPGTLKRCTESNFIMCKISTCHCVCVTALPCPSTQPV